MSDYYLVLTSWPDFKGATAAAKRYLENKLAANVNILPEMHSMYFWEGEYNSGTEHQMILKTTADKVDMLENEIRQQHPYPLAEILRIAIDSGDSSYLAWISRSTR